MPIQFAEHSELPLPLLFSRAPVPSSGRSALPDICSDATSARLSAVTAPRRLAGMPTLESVLFPVHPAADAALRPFLEADSEAEAQKHLQFLIQRKAAPIITRVIRQKWHVTLHRAYGSVQHREEWEAQDMYQDTLVLLIARLRACREDRAQPVITRFSAYVAMTAARVCAERMRRARPERERCRQRVRYLLKTHPDLASWRDDWDRATCGLREWEGRNPSPAALLRLQAWEAQNRSVRGGDELLSGAGLANLLAWLGGPVSRERLVGVLCATLQLSEPTDGRPSAAKKGQTEEDATDPLANLKDDRVEVASDVEQRIFLRWLWTEIMALPPRQRAALLLNLRDAQNRGVLALLAHARVATQTEIAQALGLLDKDLMAFWPALPLEDDGIAELLSCTRQQVSNLRKAARARLARHADCYEQA